jgi:hypothetical protein
MDRQLPEKIIIGKAECALQRYAMLESRRNTGVSGVEWLGKPPQSSILRTCISAITNVRNMIIRRISEPQARKA